MKNPLSGVLLLIWAEPLSFVSHDVGNPWQVRKGRKVCQVVLRLHKFHDSINHSLGASKEH